jgi:hypothetical protein
LFFSISTACPVDFKQRQVTVGKLISVCSTLSHSQGPVLSNVFYVVIHILDTLAYWACKSVAHGHIQLNSEDTTAATGQRC